VVLSHLVIQLLFSCAAMELFCWQMGPAGVVRTVRSYGITMVTSMWELAVFLPSTADPERAELLACRLAVNLVHVVGVTRLIMETDCMCVVSKLRSTEMNRSVHGLLVEVKISRDSCRTLVSSRSNMPGDRRMK
jgi:hypothetical protein